MALFSKPLNSQEDQTMPTITGSRFFAQAMQAYGVTHIFFVPTMLLPALAEMEDMYIRRVMTLGEKAADTLVDGYDRVSRRMGTCVEYIVGDTYVSAGR